MKATEQWNWSIEKTLPRRREGLWDVSGGKQSTHSSGGCSVRTIHENYHVILNYGTSIGGGGKKHQKFNLSEKLHFINTHPFKANAFRPLSFPYRCGYRNLPFTFIEQRIKERFVY